MGGAWLLALDGADDAAGLGPAARGGPGDPPPDQVFVAGADEARGLALDLGLPLAWPTLGLAGPGLQALASAALAVASGHLDQALALAGPRAGAPPDLRRPGAAWRLSSVPEEEADLLARAAIGAGPEDPDPAEGEPPTPPPEGRTWLAARLAGDRAAEGRPRLARVVGLAATAADPGWRRLAPARALQALAARVGLRPASFDLVLLPGASPLARLAARRALGLPAPRLPALDLGELGPALAQAADRGLRFVALAAADAGGQGLALLLDLDTAGDGRT